MSCTAHRSFIRKSLLFLCPAALALGQTAGNSGNSGAPDIQSAWDQVISGPVAAATPDPALVQAQSSKPKSDLDDLLAHFYGEVRANYQRYQTNFTGNPTYSGVINAPFYGVFNPAGIPSLTAFEPTANRVQTFLDFGTRGYGSERVNTHVAMRYRADLTHVSEGSPGQNVIETFPGAHILEVLEANVEVNSKPTDGMLAGSTFTFGRLNVYGAELASFDGASFGLSKRKFDLTLFGGRRFSYFSDPDQRGIGGANLNIKVAPGFSIGIETLTYIHASNRLIVRKRVNEHMLLTGYVRSFGGSFTDLYVSGLFTTRDEKTSLRAGFFQKLSNNDYTYDYTSGVRDLDLRNPLYRLYLGFIPRYTQIDVEGHMQIMRNLRGGAAFVVRRINKEAEQGPYDTSFEDYKFNGQYFPFKKIETYFEYHQRNSDRLNPLTITSLDDSRASGETSVKDMTGEIRRTFGEGRFNLNGGVYYRRISMQNPFFYITNIHQSGVLGGAWVRLDRRTRAYFDYSLDNDFFLFRPDIKNSQMVRIGLNWKY
jgi:hypothetical protein